MTKIKHTVHISTVKETGCEHCTAIFGADDFANAVNHYIEKHGYTLIHVGTETEHDSEGRPCHSTVAMLGKYGVSKE
jgi:tRNA U54 and U55 pseudouridine synthase Pus10